MDKGAHFYRCDFQVHTPRDRQWCGESATTEEERRAYARDFVAACIERGIDAVAITDHHDMTLVRYIRDAANAAPVGSRRLTVFPGMELTLGVPCQALLIFDATFPDDLFALSMTALAIAPASDAADKTAETTRLNHLTSLKKVQEDLDKHTYLRGRYILLPNVSEGGTSTLLRSGHAAHYADMNCVGGYLDGDVSQHGAGNRRIVDGRDPSYGSRSIGLFQTSDNRRRDFATLGTSTTWVKWAEPTAEALRQGCLARESRLSQSVPQLPQIVVTALEVSNSSFLGPLRIELNPQFNALIGGRGTGKSTILEYLRWGLCDVNEVDISDGNRRSDLIAQTLTPLNATVDVHLLLNGVAHVVRRQSSDGSVALRIGAGAFEPCLARDICSLLPIQAYSQKQLSNVGVRLDELRRFVREPIRADLVELQRAFHDTAGAIRSAYSNLVAYRRLEAERLDDERSLRSLTEQSAAIRADLSGISETDRLILNSKPARDSEAETVRSIRVSVSRVRSALVTASDSLKSLRAEDSPNAEVRAAAEALTVVVTRIVGALSDQMNELEQCERSSGAIGNSLSGWQLNHDAFLEQYEAAKARSSTQQGKLDQVTMIEDRARETRERMADRQIKLDVFGDPVEVLANARATWCGLHERQTSLLAAQCVALTELSDGHIRALLAPGGVADLLEERLRASLTGANIRREKIKGVADRIGSAPIAAREAHKILDELEALVRNRDAVDRGALTGLAPTFVELGFSAADLQRVSDKITVDSWIELATTQIEDQPAFSYRLRENEYIPFANASAGQQATALLWALLNLKGPPLVIDQPEDDLDNQILLRVVEQIWRAKESRQLIFSSHNANVVVNGDADLVVCCDYRIVGEQAGGMIKSEGAIDLAPVRQDIASIMEGGKAAFRLRQDKYGF